MQLEMVGMILSLVVGACSAAATAYVWLVRRWRERPHLVVEATSPIKHVADEGERARWLALFAPPTTGEKVRPSYQYLMFEAEVFNHSLLPDAIHDLRASLRREDGGWQPFTTAFVPGPRHTDGPFSRLRWEYETADGWDDVREHDGMPLPEPQSLPLRSEESVRLQLVLWVEVPHERQWVRWRRIRDRVAAAGRAVLAELATPLEVRLELDAQAGGALVVDLVPPAEEAG
ncbi:MAG: hypothetical protein ACRC33_15650, partial [Gemmataceae bacterium]